MYSELPNFISAVLGCLPVLVAIACGHHVSGTVTCSVQFVASLAFLMDGALAICGDLGYRKVSLFMLRLSQVMNF
jgi:hypothetical protein